MDKPKRKQIRLPEYDYSSAGVYFVTICTHEKRRILSDVVVGAIHESPAAEVRLTPAGEIVQRVLNSLPERFPDLQIDHSVIMPNHIHMLLRITGERALREAPLRPHRRECASFHVCRWSQSTLRRCYNRNTAIESVFVSVRSYLQQKTGAPAGAPVDFLIRPLPSCARRSGHRRCPRTCRASCGGSSRHPRR